MIEIRVHGRGGQGAVTSTELIALAAINEGKYAQAFPSFGPERRGAPVMAFARISDKPIRTREKVYTPDVVVVLDPTILKIVDVTDGLKKNGMVILNTSKDEKEIRKTFWHQGEVGPGGCHGDRHEAPWSADHQHNHVGGLDKSVRRDRPQVNESPAERALWPNCRKKP